MCCSVWQLSHSQAILFICLFAWIQILSQTDIPCSGSSLQTSSESLRWLVVSLQYKAFSSTFIDSDSGKWEITLKYPYWNSISDRSDHVNQAASLPFFFCKFYFSVWNLMFKKSMSACPNYTPFPMTTLHTCTTHAVQHIQNNISSSVMEGYWYIVKHM